MKSKRYANTIGAWYVTVKTDEKGLLSHITAMDSPYYVSNKKELNFEAMKLWMFQVMEFGNYLVTHVGLYKRIIMEPFTFDTGVMDGIVKAMLHFKMLDFTYEDMNNRQMVAPYYIKVHHQKAYLLGKPEDSNFKWYDLEKIHDVKILETVFKMDDNPEILTEKC